MFEYNMLRNLIVLAGLVSTALHAGPPLICHPFEIGSAHSLPWGTSTAGGWDNPDASYDLHRLQADTLALLNPQTAVLARMETIRRAAIYGVQDAAVMKSLLSSLQGRTGKSTALALFDYGYMLATLKQIEWRYKQDLSDGIDGYALVKKALAIEANPEMHFAAAIIASSAPVRPAERNEHLQLARAASSDRTLAQNVSNLFKD